MPKAAAKEPSKWTVIDVTGMPKSAKENKILKKFEEGKVRTLMKVEIVESKEERGGKRCCTVTCLRSEYDSDQQEIDTGAWIFEEDYGASDLVVDGDTRIKASDFPAK
jgi:hypothetical protein